MEYRITIERWNGSDAGGSGAPSQKVYEQVFDDIDLRTVIAAVNKRPRASRAKKKQEQA